MHILFTWETPLVTHGPRSIFLHCLQPHLLAFHHHYFSGHFWFFHIFHHTINHFVFCETGEIDNLSAVGDKVFGWMCADPRLLKVSLSARDLQHSPRCWFQSPTGSINLGSLKEGKLLLATIPPSLGAPPNSSPPTIKQFSGAIARNRRNIQSRQLCRQQVFGCRCRGTH